MPQGLNPELVSPWIFIEIDGAGMLQNVLCYLKDPLPRRTSEEPVLQLGLLQHVSIIFTEQLSKL